LDQALLSLDKMIYGGIYDQLQGGFARYCTDNEWLIPHFEKMLYDNALLISVLSEAYQLTGNKLYSDTITQTLDFVNTEWQSAEGGIYSAYDADSEGVEGKFYIWSKAEIIEILGGDTGELFCSYYDVTDRGNWEHTNILWVRQPLKDYCNNYGLNLEATQEKLQMARQKLLQIRQKRIKPLLDDKIILGWNALMITGCCKAYAAIQNPQHLEMAIRAEQFISRFFQNEDGGLYHNYKNGAANPAFLDDMAYYIQGLIQLAEVTGDNDYLKKAKTYTEKVISDFQDAESPFFFYTPVWQTDIIMRKKEWYDGATPSGNSVMADNLHYLSIIFDVPAWKTQAIQMVETVIDTALRYPVSFSNWCTLAMQIEKGTLELVVSGMAAQTLHHEILQQYWPNKVLQSQFTQATGFPLLESRWQDNSTKTTGYLCRDYVCKLPVDNIDALKELVNE